MCGRQGLKEQCLQTLGLERTGFVWTLRAKRTVFADIRACKDRVCVDVKG